MFGGLHWRTLFDWQVKVLTSVIRIYFLRNDKISVFLIDRNANFLDIDDCVNHTCANGGLCVDGINNYSCNCSAGYTGERCLNGRSKFLPLS